MVTYQRLSYNVADSTPLSLLREWIEADTKVPAREQELFIGTGQQIDPNGLVGQCLSINTQVLISFIMRVFHAFQTFTGLNTNIFKNLLIFRSVGVFIRV